MKYALRAETYRRRVRRPRLFPLMCGAAAGLSADRSCNIISHLRRGIGEKSAGDVADVPCPHRQDHAVRSRLVVQKGDDFIEGRQEERGLPLLGDGFCEIVAGDLL